MVYTHKKTGEFGNPMIPYDSMTWKLSFPVVFDFTYAKMEETGYITISYLPQDKLAIYIYTHNMYVCIIYIDIYIYIHIEDIHHFQTNAMLKNLNSSSSSWDPLSGAFRWSAMHPFESPGSLHVDKGWWPMWSSRWGLNGWENGWDTCRECLKWIGTTKLKSLVWFFSPLRMAI